MIKYREITASETFILAQASKLQHEVTLLHGPLPRIYNREHKIGKTTKLLSEAIALSSKCSSFIYTELIKKQIRNSEPELVFIQYGSTAAKMYKACLQTNKPYIIHFHGFDAHRTRFLEKNQKAYKAMLRHAAGIIVVSESMKKNLLRLGADPSKMFLVPCGIDLSKFKEKVGSDYFLAVGRLVEKKAPHLMITAFSKVQKQYPHYKLFIIGTGPLLARCQKLVGDLGLDHLVNFLGQQNHQTVNAYLMNTFIFLQHSVTAEDGDSEGSPVAIAEAAACGIPVVSTRHAGIPEIVKDGDTGFLVQEGDVEGMTRAILGLIDDSKLYAMMSGNARRHIIEHFDQNKQVAKLNQIIEQAIVESPKHCRVVEKKN